MNDEVLIERLAHLAVSLFATRQPLSNGMKQQLLHDLQTLFRHELRDTLPVSSSLHVSALRGGSDRMLQLSEALAWPSARALIQHHRPRPDGSMELLSEEESTNVITNSGRDFFHNQVYGTSGLGTNGLNFLGLSNDTLTETSSSTALSNEITANGLGRAQGTVTHTAGTNTTTVSKVFTATGNQSAQKAALFTAISSGIMCHALAFTQRALVSGDTLTVTFTLTVG